MNRGPVGPGGRISPSRTGNIGLFSGRRSLEENVRREDGVVLFEVPPAREQVRRFCTTLNPFSNRHCLFFSGLSCVVSEKCVNQLSAGERNRDVDSAIVLCSSEHLRRRSLEENVRREDGVVPFEVPPAREQVRRFCTTLNPFSNRHCLFFSGLSCVVSEKCVNQLSAGERNRDVDSAIVLCSSEHLRRRSLEENVRREDGVVPFEVPPAREQVRRFCTTLNPFSNRHCLFFSGLSCVIS